MCIRDRVERTGAGRRTPRPSVPPASRKLMVLPLRSIPVASGTDAHQAVADTLDELASQLHDVVASDRRPRLAKARVGAWVRALLDTLFPQVAEQTYLSLIHI